MPVLLTAVIAVLTEAPQLVNGAKALWQALGTLHQAGLIQLNDANIAAMNQAGVTLAADIASLAAAAGPKPA